MRFYELNWIQERKGIWIWIGISISISVTYLWFRRAFLSIVILPPLWRLEVQNIISNGCSTKFEKKMHAVSTLVSMSEPNWNSNVMPFPPCFTNKRLQSSMDKTPFCDDGGLNDGNGKQIRKELVSWMIDGNNVIWYWMNSPLLQYNVHLNEPWVAMQRIDLPQIAPVAEGWIVWSSWTDPSIVYLL